MKGKVIVFGGSGFIGSYLVNELLRRNYDVTVADIKELHEKIPVKFFYCDILDRKQIHKILQSEDYGIVYNFAGFSNLDLSINFPYETFNLNVLGNINILDGVIASGSCNRFVYASSAYAMSDKGSFYGISKLASEKLVEEYQNRYSLNFSIVRYGSIYSEIPFDNNYIYSIVEKAVLTNQIIHDGDGMELREYIHALDAAKLSVDIIESDEFINQHVILTGVEKMHRIELFRLINEIMKNRIDIQVTKKDYHKNHYHYTPYSFNPSVSKKLTANPHIDMGQGILECIRSVYRNHKLDEYEE